MVHLRRDSFQNCHQLRQGAVAKNMGFRLICAFIISNLLFIQAKEEGSFCKTPNGLHGNCISIYSCNFVLKLIDAATDPMQWAEIPKAYSCGGVGNELRVCCPKEKKTENVLKNEPPDVSNHHNLKLLPEDCGVSETEDKITHGNKTGIFQYPWMARLLYNTSSGPKFKCAGTIINERYILTAAHCTGDSGLIGVRVGDHNFNTDLDCEFVDKNRKICAPPPQNLKVEDIIKHPEFNANRGTNDIALLRVSRIDFSSKNANVKSICLPLENIRNYNITGRFGAVTGWGKTENTHESPDLLQVNLFIISLEDCQKTYEKTPLNHRQLCAGGKTRSDSCFGDSGGPIQIHGNLYGDVRMIQHGIVSYGRYNSKCGQFAPGVYSKVVYFMKWILDNIKP